MVVRLGFVGAAAVGIGLCERDLWIVGFVFAIIFIVGLLGLRQWLCGGCASCVVVVVWILMGLQWVNEDGGGFACDVFIIIIIIIFLLPQWWLWLVLGDQLLWVFVVAFLYII